MLTILTETKLTLLIQWHKGTGDYRISGRQPNMLTLLVKGER